MYDLIKGEIEKIKRKYIDSAEEIVSGYNREYSLSKDYEGRCLNFFRMQMMRQQAHLERC